MPTSFEQYATANYAALRRLAFLLCADWHEAEDLLQSTLVTCHRRWARIESDDPNAYVRRALVNSANNWRRRRRPVVPLDERWASPDAIEHADRRLTLVRALAGLPVPQRQVLVLRYYEQLSEAQIATVLGVAPGTVKSRAARGLEALRTAGLVQDDVETGDRT